MLAGLNSSRLLMSLRQLSFFAFVLVISSPIVAWLIDRYISGELAMLYGGGAIIGGLWIGIRMRCVVCKKRVSARFPYRGGGAILAWLVRTKCPHCEVQLW